jgi:tetratricopeptide (TPR) repeat protein
LGYVPEAAPGGGVSVRSDVAGPAYSASLYPWFHYGWSELRAVREGRWTYIRAPRPELYDTDADPAQLHDLSAERPDLAAQLDAAIDRFAAEERAAEPEALGDAGREALESLGYVTDTAGAARGGGAAAAGEPLADPKDMIRIQALIYESMRAMSAGRWADARRDLQRALSRDPDNREAHKIMGLLHSQQGRDDLAVDSFRRAMELGPDADDNAARVVLAAALMRLGLHERAARHFAVVAETDSLNPESWFNYGQSLRAQGHTDEAITALRRALELNPDLQVAKDALESCEGRLE